MPSPAFGTPFPFKTNRDTSATFVSLQLSATILIKPVSVSLIQVPEGLGSDFLDKWGPSLISKGSLGIGARSAIQMQLLIRDGTRVKEKQWTLSP